MDVSRDNTVLHPSHSGIPFGPPRESFSSHLYTITSIWQAHLDVFTSVGKGLRWEWDNIANGRYMPAEPHKASINVNNRNDDDDDEDNDGYFSLMNFIRQTESECDHNGREDLSMLFTEVRDMLKGGDLSLPTDTLTSAPSAVRIVFRSSHNRILLLFSLLDKTIQNLVQTISNVQGEFDGDMNNGIRHQTDNNSMNINNNNSNDENAPSSSSFRRMDYESHLQKAVKPLLFDSLRLSLVPNIVTFCIAPMNMNGINSDTEMMGRREEIRSLAVQRSASNLMVTLLNTFNAKIKSENIGSDWQLLSGDDWDEISEEHSLREALEVGIEGCLKSMKENWKKGPEDRRTSSSNREEEITRLQQQQLTTISLVELLLLLTSVSESVATSILCESETFIATLLEMMHRCLEILRCFDSTSLGSRSRVDLLLSLPSEFHLQQMGLLCNLLCLFDVLICQIPDASHVIVETYFTIAESDIADGDEGYEKPQTPASLPSLLLSVLSIPCNGGTFKRNSSGISTSSPSASAAIISGIATTQGLALQVLSHLTDGCFLSFGPALLLPSAHGGASIQNALIRNIISTSPFAELVEASLLWLEKCIRLLGSHVVGMTATTSTSRGVVVSANENNRMATRDNTISMSTATTRNFEKETRDEKEAIGSNDRHIATQIFRSFGEQYALIYSLQEIIQNLLTARVPTPSTRDLTSSHPHPQTQQLQQYTAICKTASAALVCLTSLLVFAPWELQIPRHVATEHKTLLGLLITMIRRNRVSHGDCLDIVSLPHDTTKDNAHSTQQKNVPPTTPRLSLTPTLKGILNVFSTLALGVVCTFSRIGRMAVAELLTSPAVMGAGKSVGAATLTAQTLSTVWSDVERYLSLTVPAQGTATYSEKCEKENGASLRPSSASDLFSIFLQWHLHDEHGTQLVPSSAFAESFDAGNIASDSSKSHESKSQNAAPPPSIHHLMRAIAHHAARDILGDHLRSSGNGTPLRTASPSSTTMQKGIGPNDFSRLSRNDNSVANRSSSPSRNLRGKKTESTSSTSLCSDIGHLLNVQQNLTDGERAQMICKAQAIALEEEAERSAVGTTMETPVKRQNNSSTCITVPLVLYGALHETFRKAADLLALQAANVEVSVRMQTTVESGSAPIVDGGKIASIPLAQHPCTVAPALVESSHANKEDRKHKALIIKNIVFGFRGHNLTTFNCGEGSNVTVKKTDMMTNDSKHQHAAAVNKTNPSVALLSCLEDSSLTRRMISAHNKQQGGEQQRVVEHEFNHKNQNINRKPNGSSSLPRTSALIASNVMESTNNFTDTMSLIVSLAHHYIGNIIKLRQLETEMAKRKLLTENKGSLKKNANRDLSSKFKDTMLNTVGGNSLSGDQSKSSSMNSGCRNSKSDCVSHSTNSKSSALSTATTKKILFSATAQQTRSWSVRDIQPSDLITITVPLFKKTSANHDERRASCSSLTFSSETILSATNLPSNKTSGREECDDASQRLFFLQNLHILHRNVKAHLVSLHEQLAQCPIHFPSRRCLLGDLYRNVYPKILLYVRGIIWALSSPSDMNASVCHSTDSKNDPKNRIFNALVAHIVGERREDQMYSGNLVEIHKFLENACGNQ